MNLCVIADLHGDNTFVQKLRDIEYDVLVICGDITNFGKYAEAVNILDSVPEPYVAVHGNCDYEDVATALDEKGCNLHKNQIKIKGETFCGFGGGNTFLGRTPSEYPEKEILQALSNIPEGCILVTHVPPKNTKTDRVLMVKHVGSTAVRQIIEEKNPKMCLCGHIHESRNIDRVNETLVVNPGEFSKGYYSLVDTDDKTCTLEQFR
jgi:Icc-related predicted phosphoesterase